MKNKILTLTFVIIGHIILHGQNCSDIKYKVSLSEEFASKSNNSGISLVNKALKDNIGDFIFTLKICNNRSLFYGDKVLEKEDNNKVYLKIAKALTQYNNIYYVDNSSKIEQLTSFGQGFIVTDELNSFDWSLSKETKKIGKYICYKATTFKTIVISTGTKRVEIIAWYTPEISYSYGPKGFNGLPGLILELKDNKFTYFATKVALNQSEKMIIKKPNNGKKVTREEYNNIVKNTEVNYGGN